MTTTPDPVTPRSRRALLGAAAGGLAGLLASRLARPDEAEAAAGGPLVLGAANSAGTANTSLTTASSATALLVTQTGSGTALRGSAVGPGSIAGFFTAANGTGISGVTGSGSSYGVYGANNGADSTAGAMRAAGGNNHGLVATTANGAKAAVVATTTATSIDGAAVRAYSGNNYGVYATSNDGYGVYGFSFSRIGVSGESFSGTAVRGYSGIGTGVYGQSDSSDAGTAGVYGSSTGYALYGNGNGAVTGNFSVGGTLSKASGTFKIDHPGDPARKYLQHSFVESPDMKNVYDGLVTLDAAGRATVKLPAYFETLNRDLRYQLTPIGAFSPLYVKAKLAKGSFSIAGGSPGQEVCWQVTGIRKDPWAEAHPVVVEEPKTGKERGTYLHPELYGQPKEKGLDWPNRPKARDLPRSPEEPVVAPKP